MSGQHTLKVRLAMRQEGEFWNAYFAPSDTMHNAILVGSLRLTIAKHPQFKKAFMELMQEAIGAAIQDTIGVEPTWPEPQPAPDHERTRE
jgi:hypothetical protein